jgi:DNA repair photolyase
MLAPVIPGLTDSEMEAILTAARDAGAQAASYIALRLPREVSPLFHSWLSRHAPDRAAKVMARVREMHGGRDYDPEFGKRMHGAGVWADLMATRFHKAVDRLGLAVKMPPMGCDRFRVPTDQLSLFD